MRWRFADKIDRYTAWESIAGRKGISFEEYSLLDRFGRRGEAPGCLVLETCVHLARWLVLASSDWNKSCLLEAVDNFALLRATHPGDLLQVVVKVTERGDSRVRVASEVCSENIAVARGALDLALIEARDIHDLDELKILYQELYGPA